MTGQIGAPAVWRLARIDSPAEAFFFLAMIGYDPVRGVARRGEEGCGR